MRLKSLVGALGFCALAFPVQSMAALINSTLLASPLLNQFQDTDNERILTWDIQTQTYVTKTSGDLIADDPANGVKGDIIQTVLKFDSSNGKSFQQWAIEGTLPITYQLSAFSELLVTGISNCQGGALNVCDLTFGASGRLQTAGSMVDLYETTVFSEWYVNDGSQSPATSIAKIQSQDYLLSAGLLEADDFWTASAPLDVSVVAGALGPGFPQTANGIFGISVLANPGGIPVQKNGVLGADGKLHDLIANLSAFQNQDNCPTPSSAGCGWLLESNATVNFRVVPEPGSLALVGLSLLGVGLARRKLAAAA